MGNVFSERVTRLNAKAGKTYQEMASDCDFKRSVTWWNKVRWNEIEDPPKPSLYPYLARALEVPVRRVAEMVAEQWCGVRPDDTVPEHLRSLLAVLRDVREEDVSVIHQMARAMCEKRGAEAEVERISARLLTAFGESDGPYTLEQLEWLKLPELQAVKMDVGMGRAEVEEDAYALLDSIPDPGDE
ncbi:hypothetical protein [Streptomyces sp. Go-475]|uniref:hypothetical protein n=1 Tax=Streptomyces sp. Go-475 TaxID=2072505 RepID=UPI001300B3DA|nr:hypothetical protein [Streptomyces sp. Go-475]